MSIDFPCISMKANQDGRKYRKICVKIVRMNKFLQPNYSFVPMAKSGGNPVENNENNFKNISPFMSKDLIAAAGFNVETPIVSAILGNLTGTLPTKKDMTELKCSICGCELSSFIVLKLHINGSKHKKRLKALEIIDQLRNKKDNVVNLGDRENPNSFRCEVCLLTVNSAQQLEIHLSGAKHKRKAAKAGITKYQSTISRETHEKSQISDFIGSLPVKKQKNEEANLISCDICKIYTNSRIQYDQHLVSKRHLNRVSFHTSHLVHH